MKKKKMVTFFMVFSGVLLTLMIILLYSVFSNGQSSRDVSDTPANRSSTSSSASTTTSKQSHSVYQSTTVTTWRSTKSRSLSETTPTTLSADNKTFNLLTDPGFLSGFKVYGLSTADGGHSGSGVFNPLENVGRQYWDLAQWDSRYGFMDPQHTTRKDLGDGVFSLVNTTKEFTVDTKNAAITFTGFASKCYDTHRTGNEPWLTLLIGQNFKTANSKITDLDRVVVSMSNRLILFENHMGSAFNTNIHAAQFLMYFLVRNQDSTSADYNKFIWFGFPLFDNRHEWINPSSMLDKGTSALMVSIGNKVLYESNGKNHCWKNGKINAGRNTEWSTFQLDVLPLIKNALDTAHNDGYLISTSIDQLVIANMNLGWEIPGTYDASMEMKNFSIIITKK